MVAVLYIDDDEILLDLCREYLGKTVSITVDTALSGETGLNMIAEHEYDAIICDYEMPEMTGIDVLKTLRSRKNPVPFIIFTGRGREEIAMEAINSGADFYIQKGGDPRYQFAELVHKVKTAVRRRQGEQALEASNSVLRATLESTADGILVVDPDGTISTINTKARLMWRIPADAPEPLTEDWFLTHIHDQVLDYGAFRTPVALARQHPDDVTYDIIACKDGRVFRRYSQAQRIRETIAGRVWSYRDITGQHNAETELRAAYEQLAAAEEELQCRFSELEKSTELIRESEEKYRGVFQAERSPLLLVDLETLEILDLNAAASAMYGFDRDEMLSLPFSHLSAEARETADEIRLELPEPLSHFHRKKNSTVFPVEISCGRCRIAERAVLIVAIRDLSHTKQIESALRLANIKLNLLLGITRHDILNNLTGLSGYNELLRSRTDDPEAAGFLDNQKKLLSAIQKQIDFTREYEQLGVKNPRWFRVSETAARAYAQILQTIVFRCETGDLEIYADPMLESVFYNLFDNAFRYGGGISRITITRVLDGEDLRVIFADDGNGVANDEKERIFLRGYGKNTGLGLYLSREILSITGMTIRETGRQGEGARFEIRVPEGNYRFLDHPAEPTDYAVQHRIPADE